MKGPGVPFDFERDHAGLKEVKEPKDYPEGVCYLIHLWEDHSVSHEGDERSRTHPGHGYPAYTEHFRTCRTFVTQNEEIWRQALADLYEKDRNRTDVSAIVGTVAAVKTKLEVTM